MPKRSDSLEIQPSTLWDLNAVRELENLSFPLDAWPLIEMIGVLSLPSIERWKAVLDEKLVKEGLAITHFRTKTELINTALAEMVKRLKRKAILNLSGSSCWEGNLARMRKGRS